MSRTGRILKRIASHFAVMPRAFLRCPRSFPNLHQEPPNHIPLGALAIEQIVKAVEPFEFDRIYGAFWDRVIETDGKAVVKQSAEPVFASDWTVTLGEYDGLLILEAPNDETATAAILHLGAMGNVHTTTCQAFTAAEMDKIVGKVHGG